MPSFSKQDQTRRPKPEPRQRAWGSSMAQPTQPMNQMSERRKTFYRETYRPLRDAAIGDGRNPCQIVSPVCTGYGQHLHEIVPRGRAGGLESALRDGDTTIACDACNDYIGEHPVWSHERGWLKHSWEGRDSVQESAQ